MYEVAHVREPEHTLLDHVRFESGGVWAKPSDESCRQEQDTYVCTADYQFPAPVETVQVECTLASVTVPNHVHLLRAYRGDKIGSGGVRSFVHAGGDPLPPAHGVRDSHSRDHPRDSCALPGDWRRCCFSSAWCWPREAAAS